MPHSDNTYIPFFWQVYEFVRLPELYYAGSHGMDIMGPAEGYNGVTVEGLQTKDSKVFQTINL